MSKSIDEFIAQYPETTQKLLQQMRAIIHDAVPHASETISYGIPTFTFHGNLVHFSAYEHHLGFYPGAQPIETFAAELKPYKTSKGTVQFPIDKPLPADLIKRMTLAAAERNLSKLSGKNR